MNSNNDFIESLSEEERSDLIDLYSAILTMEDTDEMHNFLTDLCSVNELRSLLHRWQIVLGIDSGMSYEEIIRHLTPSDGTGKGTVSSTTISRVKNCYVREGSGYRTALKRLRNKKTNDNEVN